MEQLNRAGAALIRIEGALESLIDSLLRHEPLGIALVPRRRRRRGQTHVPRVVRFPGRTAQEAQRFGILRH
jgi:hypothetical protein